MPQLRIRIYPDGSSKTETIGVKGEQCKKLIPVIENITSSKCVSTELTAEYYENDILETDILQTKTIEANDEVTK